MKEIIGARVAVAITTDFEGIFMGGGVVEFHLFHANPAYFLGCFDGRILIAIKFKNLGVARRENSHTSDRLFEYVLIETQFSRC